MTTITTLPTAPSRSNAPATFITLADNLLAALAGFVTQANAMAGELNAMVGAVTAGTVISQAYTFDSTTSDADPTSGKFRLNNATQDAATKIWIDNLNGSAVDVSAIWSTIAASTSANKGQLKLQETGTPANWIIFNVTATTDKTGYYEITIAKLTSSASSPFGNGDGITVTFTRTGDVGTFTGTLSNADLAGIKVPAFNSEISNSGTTGAQTVNWTLGAAQKQTEPTGIITYTFTAPSVSPCHLQLRIISDGTSTAYTHVWPASVKWVGATWAAIANKGAVINFWYDGTDYWANGGNSV